MLIQPSASEWNMLCSLAQSVAGQAASEGESRALFHGYQLSARRLHNPTSEGAYVELSLTQAGSLIDFERTWVN